SNRCGRRREPTARERPARGDGGRHFGANSAEPSVTMAGVRRARARAASTFSALVICGLAGTPAALAQAPVSVPGPGGRSWSVEIGAVRTTAFVDDGNGVTVRGATGPFVGAAVTLRRSHALSLVTGVRASTTAIRVESSDR